MNKYSKPLSDREIEGVIHRLTISRCDWDKCLQLLTELNSHQYASLAYEALLIASIILYARPFTNNEKGRAVRAIARVDSTVLENLTQEQVGIHKKILELRNQTIAHMESIRHPVLVSGSIIISNPFSIWLFFKPAHVQDFKNLVVDVLKKANQLSASYINIMTAGSSTADA